MVSSNVFVSVLNLFQGVEMTDISSLLSPVLIWFLVGIGFFVVELILPGFIMFFFGIGAWCVAATLAIVSLSQNTQLTVFIVSSLASLFLLRSWLRSVFWGEESEESDSVNVNSAPTTGMVTETISPPAPGRVKYGGSSWQAVAEELIPADTVVEVIERQDLIITVRKLNKEQKEKK
jgi:membrane protein implicated in regulation of membrane protease activity